MKVSTSLTQFHVKLWSRPWLLSCSYKAACLLEAMLHLEEMFPFSGSARDVNFYSSKNFRFNNAEVEIY